MELGMEEARSEEAKKRRGSLVEHEWEAQQSQMTDRDHPSVHRAHRHHSLATMLAVVAVADNGRRSCMCTPHELCGDAHSS